MDRERAKELLPFIEAFANGEDVKLMISDGKWESKESFSFSRIPDHYRIKPKPREWIINVKDGSIINGFQKATIYEHYGSGGGIVVREVI